jgi:hypothetical protein
MTRLCLASLITALALIIAAPGVTQSTPVPSRPKLLPPAQETTLALSAGPASIRAGAGVYVLENRGYVKVRKSTNGFTCIVNRDHPLNTKPTCYDAEGTATIIPVDLKFGELLMQGVPVDKIHSLIRAGFKDGTYRSPRRPGVAYMLSDTNFDYDAASGQLMHFPPHVMFYAPNLTNKDIGSAGDFEPGLPSIGYQGPQGFMIVVMPASTPTCAHAHPRH